MIHKENSAENPHPVITDDRLNSGENWIRATTQEILDWVQDVEVAFAEHRTSIPTFDPQWLHLPKLERAAIDVLDPYLLALLQVGELPPALSALSAPRQTLRDKRGTVGGIPVSLPPVFDGLSPESASRDALRYVRSALRWLNHRGLSFSVGDFPLLSQKVEPARVLPVRPGGREARLLFDVLDELRRRQAPSIEAVRLTDQEILTVVSQLVLRFDIPVHLDGWPPRGKHHEMIFDRTAFRTDYHRDYMYFAALRLTVTPQSCTFSIDGTTPLQPVAIPADILLALSSDGIS